MGDMRKGELTDEERANLDKPGWQRHADEVKRERAVNAEEAELKAHAAEMRARAEGETVQGAKRFPVVRESTWGQPRLDITAGHLTEKDISILLSTAQAGEPIVIFRAKDLLSNFVLKQYLELLETHVSGDSDIHQRVWEKLNSFRGWQHDHPESVRFPD